MTQFEKEIFDRLGEVKESLARMETKLDADYKALHGNGRPGVVEQTQDLTRRLDAVEDRLNAAEKSGRHAAGFVAWLVATATAVYAAFFKN